MRLIDADNLITVLVADCCADQKKELPVWIEQRIDEQPDIVRCKDCKHAEILEWLDGAIVCKKHSFTGVRPEEFYCADGERGNRDA